MKLITLLILLGIYSFAYEKGYIDTHGGKNDLLIDKNSNFSKNLSLNSPFSKTKEIKKTNNNENEKINSNSNLDSINNFIQGK